jgi:restriction system protein
MHEPSEDAHIEFSGLSRMPVPDYQTLMLPVLRHAAQGETRVPEIADKLADEFALTKEERDRRYTNGQTVLHNRVHWAKTYLSKAGLITSPRRGRFVASEEGRKVLTRNPERIDVALLLKYPEFKEFYRGGSGEENTGAASNVVVPPAQTAVPATTPEDQIEAAYLTLQTALRADLLQRILQNSPSFFETVIVNLLVGMGYGGSHINAATQLGRSGDGGVDGVINEDRLGLDRVYVQAKRYAPSNSVGRPEVQAFVGSLVGLGAAKGVFVTTSTFSSQAREFVKHLSQRVILIDGQRLGDLLIEYNVGVRVSRLVEFKRVDEDFFSEDG